MEDIYPLTIIKDRYSGVYSGGEFLAFNTFPEEIPIEIHSNDISCANFWDNYEDGRTIKGLFGKSVYVGKGASITQALKELNQKLKLV